jgi:hypothetical protein
MAGEQIEQPLFVQHPDTQLLGLGQLAAGSGTGNYTVGLRRDAAGNLGAERFEMILGLIAGESFERTGQHPGLAGERQVIELRTGAFPVHAELAQLRLDGQYLLADGGALEVLAQALDCLIAQAFDLFQIQPVRIQDCRQTAKGSSQTLGAGASNEGNLQPREKLRKRDIGGELGRNVALVLRLYASLEQLADDGAVMLVGKERMNLVGDLRPDIRQVFENLRKRAADAVEAAERAGQQLGGLFADIGNAEGVDESGQSGAAAFMDGAKQIARGNVSETLQGNDLLIRQQVKVRSFT